MNDNSKSHDMTSGITLNILQKSGKKLIESATNESSKFVQINSNDNSTDSTDSVGNYDDVELGLANSENSSNTINAGQQCDLNYDASVQTTDDKKTIVEIIHYYTHFLMFVIFEILFYFNYIVVYEKNLVYKMVNSALMSIIKLLHIDTSQFDYYDEICPNFVDNRVNEDNVKIYNNALYLIIGMTIILLMLIMCETRMFTQKSTFPNELMKSLILMIFVGIFDFVFFSFFILKYKIIDNAALVCYLYEKNFSNNNDHTRF